MSKWKGSLILTLTAFIWGSAFVAQTTGSKHIGTFTFNAARGYVAALFLLLVILIINKIKKRKNSLKDSSFGDIEETNEIELNKNSSNEKTTWPIKGGVICGVVLFVAMGFQQYGISIYPEGAAAAGRAGFMTAIYVVLVAVVEQLRNRKIQWIIILAVLGTIVGMYFLCMSGGFGGIYLGDVVVFCCAICFTIHILVIDHYKHVDSFKLSCIQFLVVALLSTIVCLLLEPIDLNELRKGLFPLLYAGILSSGVAYTMQMIGQKYTKPAVASIVMSLESVFAALTGFIVLHEMMSGRELLGCTLVFASVILAQVPEMIKNKG